MILAGITGNDFIMEMYSNMLEDKKITEDKVHQELVDTSFKLADLWYQKRLSRSAERRQQRKSMPMTDNMEQCKMAHELIDHQ